MRRRRDKSETIEVDLCGEKKFFVWESMKRQGAQILLYDRELVQVALEFNLVFKV